jgi:uncharacterized protein YndB with AHSA1/START domain
MPNIYQQLLIAAPAGKVYTAITSQEGLSAWWTPHATAAAELNSIARFPFGDGYFKEMKITKLEPSRKVEWACLKGDDQWVATTISFELIAGDKTALIESRSELRGQIEQLDNVPESTVLIFSHNDWSGYTPMFAECSYTWAQFLRSLKLLCETGKGRPWPQQHHND